MSTPLEASKRHQHLMAKAQIWRALMAVGMKFHHFAEPKPPRPNFKIFIPSRLSDCGGTFKLVFYVPETYLSEPDDYRFPCVVNFHGGGFTLGTGTDDARWASAVIHDVDAIFVSVEYRLAPEFPFSVGVEDGTDALIYLAAHAEELRIDPHRMALSGFSAGGNFALTVPLMLHDLKNDAGRRTLKAEKNLNKSHASLGQYNNGSRANLGQSGGSTSSLHLPHRPNPVNQQSTNSVLKIGELEPTQLEIRQSVPDLTLQAIVSFYPPVDFRQSRTEKRATNPVPEKNLPPMLTNLFDMSYLNPNRNIDMSDPYLSPAAAEDAVLAAAYPEHIVLYTCEHDMLNVEGVAFGERLKSGLINKQVHGGLVLGAVHAFDKKPNPIAFPKSADKCYSEACAQLRMVFGGRSSFQDTHQLDEVKNVERFDDDVLQIQNPNGERSSSSVVEAGTTEVRFEKH